MDRDERQRLAIARIDACSARRRAYPKKKPKKLPENVVELPPVSIIDRAPLPLHFTFDIVCRIRAGEPITTPADKYGEHRVWVADDFMKAEFEQQECEEHICVLGRPMLVIDNARPKRLRKPLIKPQT